MQQVASQGFRTQIWKTVLEVGMHVVAEEPYKWVNWVRVEALKTKLYKSKVTSWKRHLAVAKKIKASVESHEFGDWIKVFKEN